MDYHRPSRLALAEAHTTAMWRFHYALERNPRDVDTMRNLAVAFIRLGRNDDALDTAKKLMRLAPDAAVSHTVLGYVYHRSARNVEADAYFRRALELQPDYMDARLGRAELTLRRGDLRPGFAELQDIYVRNGGRFLCGTWASSGQVQRRWWHGEDISGRTLYVRWVGGHGDVIWLARYFPILRARGVRVLLECFPVLTPFLEANDVADEYVAPGTYPPHDKTISLLSLPLAMGTTLETIPSPGPYLRAPDLSEPLREALGPSGGLRVGLVWRGNAGNPSEPWRSMELSKLAPLARVPGVRLFSLQKGDGEDEARNPPHGLESLVHLGPLMKDWSDTAAVVQELDVVVSVDTGVTHIAGALGKPTWVMLPRVAEWRWLDGWDTSPWYGSMRVFRQERLGEWGPIIDRVAAHISRLPQGHED